MNNKLIIFIDLFINNFIYNIKIFIKFKNEKKEL